MRWTELEAAVADAARHPLKEVFSREPDRLARLTLEACGLTVDLSKTILDEGVVAAGLALADEVDFGAWRAKLLSGAVVNPTEGRAATHSAERGVGSEADVKAAREARTAMKALYERIAAGDFGAVGRVVHVGIGGSFLGPALVIDALPASGPVPDVRIVSNIDAVSLERAIEGADPAKTLMIVVSKSFTTLETRMNAESVRDALGLPAERVIAVTANPDKAHEFGVAPGNILGFAETVGGRYSLWTGVGLAAALSAGWDAFTDLLEGAGEMDRHFAEAELAQNLPFMAALGDIAYASILGAESRAVFAYDERLRLLPDFLQQLETESNGKQVDRNGHRLARPSSPVVWGGVGTDAQHAVFQMLHQGTHLVPVEFLAIREPGHSMDRDHHRQLIANCIAQGAALLAGRSFEEAQRETPDEQIARAKVFDGNRPSSTVVLPRLDARTLGALIAYYEHRTFSFGALLEINSFDQMGVELGKNIARAIASGETASLDLSSKALMDRLTSG
ncbi:glucose-6-phosphate isomerase [Pacificimonas aurantium]|nr:glucose-6-phosphate isomerase [Pacificimonas aurantium]